MGRRYIPVRRFTRTPHLALFAALIAGLSACSKAPAPEAPPPPAVGVIEVDNRTVANSF